MSNAAPEFSTDFTDGAPTRIDLAAVSVPPSRWRRLRIWIGVILVELGVWVSGAQEKVRQ